MKHGVYKNNETGKGYLTICEIENSTNAQLGQVMVFYRNHKPQGAPQYHVKEIAEFLKEHTFYL